MMYAIGAVWNHTKKIDYMTEIKKVEAIVYNPEAR